MVDGVTDNGRNGLQYLGGFPVDQGKFRTRNGADILFRMPTYERKDIDPVNQRNLKALDNGGTAEFWMKGQICAIGAGHKSDLMADLKNGGFKGSIKITKGKRYRSGNPGSHGVQESAARIRGRHPPLQQEEGHLQVGYVSEPTTGWSGGQFFEGRSALSIIRRSTGNFSRVQPKTQLLL